MIVMRQETITGISGVRLGCGTQNPGFFAKFVILQGYENIGINMGHGYFAFWLVC